MDDPRAQLQALLKTLDALGPTQRALFAPRLEALAKSVAALQAGVERLRQDAEDAEHARDAANLQRMKVAGQLNTLHKALAAAAPAVAASGDPQQDALGRIEWLATHGAATPGAAQAAKSAEMDAPMPGRAVLEAVIAGTRKFTKAQLEFTIAEAMVLTGWQMTPLELTEKGEPWLAQLVLDHHAGGA